MKAEVCRFCGERIMKFSFAEGEQWWHADPARSRWTSLHCHGDRSQPAAAP